MVNVYANIHAAFMHGYRAGINSAEVKHGIKEPYEIPQPTPPDHLAAEIDEYIEQLENEIERLKAGE